MIKYTGKVSTRMANLTTAKLLLHRTVSTPGERFMCFDIKKFYLGTSMERYEYIQTLLAILPKEIVEQYNLTMVAKVGYVYAEILRGMYRLKQSRRIANEYPTKNIGPHGYYQCSHTHGLWIISGDPSCSR